MKNFKYNVGALLILAAFLFAGNTQAQICGFGSDVIVCSGKIVGQEQSGTLGTFTGTEEWSALGKAPVAGPGTDKPYGLRLQRNNTLALFQLKQREFDNCNSFTTNRPFNVKDANIFWGAVRPVGASFPTQPRLDFNYIYQDNDTQFGPAINQTNFMSLVPAACKQFTAKGSQTCCFFPSGAACYGRVGIETTCPQYTLDVNGVMEATGYLTASDRRFKQDIKTIENSLDQISKLRGTTYRFREDAPVRDFSEKGITPGMIAQEVDEVIPEVVFTGDNDYKAVNYTGLIPYLVEGIKSLDEANTQLRAEADALRAQLEAAGSTGALPKSLEGAALYQNVPNPFRENTNISYVLPEGSQQARILITDMNGQEVKSIPVNGVGEGSVTLEGNALDAGMYLYALIVGEQEVATRRMILTD